MRSREAQVLAKVGYLGRVSERMPKGRRKEAKDTKERVDDVDKSDTKLLSVLPRAKV